MAEAEDWRKKHFAQIFCFSWKQKACREEHDLEDCHIYSVEEDVLAVFFPVIPYVHSSDVTTGPRHP